MEVAHNFAGYPGSWTVLRTEPAAAVDVVVQWVEVDSTPESDVAAIVEVVETGPVSVAVAVAAAVEVDTGRVFVDVEEKGHIDFEFVDVVTVVEDSTQASAVVETAAEGDSSQGSAGGVSMQ